ncbi:DUF6612 family protein [Actinokineospora bangkokensis]|uniref:LppX_LprAFG lipoprotein n=1 Tax=Actinokineospora bangkokensis TaxID=1193682 RepID=A0A1Q9LEE1_9PSEU|nr:DUF6612 family protein [Actinokineospora bangkokensis]OLR90408.1 hypothetical protein BJP25_27545 [Actinokineospora bangkokensis]
MRKTKLMVAGALLATATLTACNSTQSGSAAPVGGQSTSSSAAPSGFDTLKSLTDAVAQKSASAKSAHVKMSSSIGSTSFTGEGDFDFAAENTAMQMSMEIPGAGAVEMILVDQTIYMKLPANLVPSDKPWIKFSQDGTDPVSQQLAGTMDQLKSSDPREALQKIVNAGEITSKEETELNGEKATHYSITVDVTKLTEESGYDAETRKAMQDAGIKEFPMEVWVNGDALPLRVVTTVPLPAAAQATAGTSEVKVTADYTDWGKSVDVQAPDPSQVGTLGG